MRGVAHEQDERGDATHGGGEDHRERLAGQLVEQVARIRPQDEDPDDGHRPGDDGGTDGAPAEVLDHGVVRQPSRVPDEVHRRQVGDDDEREHTTEDRRRVEPARPRIPGLAPRRHAAGGDATGDRTHAERHDHGPQRERGPEVAAVAGAEHGLAEGEARSAQHDPDRGDRQRDEQRQRDRGVRLGEPGPQQHEAEDQPHVVALPDGADRVVDHLARPLAAGRSSGDQIPEPGAEVGAAEDRVQHDGEQQQHGDGGAHGTGTRSSESGVSMSGPRGPYGTSWSGTSRSRNRRLILRRIRIVVMASPM